jgi:hypothetical protein
MHAVRVISPRRLSLALAVLGALVVTSCGASHEPPAGRFLIYTRHLDTASQALWIARTDGSNARLLVRNGIFGALSPDGRWVAYNACLESRVRCEGGKASFALFLIATSNGKPRLLARATTYPSWSPRSDRIVALRGGRLVSLTLDGNVRLLDRSPAISGWSFSPDGKWIVYAEARQHTQCGSDLVIVPTGGGEERVLTHGRDIFPVWGQHSIAFSRYPRGCAYRRAIWRIKPDGSSEQPVTGPSPRSGAIGRYYGFDPIEWGPGEQMLLAGLGTEWGDEAIRVDPTSGAFRKLSGYAVDLSRDGRFALVDDGGVEGPHTIATVALADGRRRVLAHGDVAFPSWNR